MDEWVLAADHHGIISTADLRHVGLSTPDVARLVRSGELTALARGWFALGRPATAEERHLLTTRALIRAWKNDVLAAHHSALLVLGLPTYRADLSRIRLVRRTPGPTRTGPDRSVGRAVPVELQHEETVAPALAVVQHGLSSGPLSALIAADAALKRHLITADELSQAVKATTFHPGSSKVKGFLALVDGRRESPGETRLAHALHLMRLPATPQARITAPGFTAYVDFLIDGENLVIEFDGQVKYGRAADEPDPYGRRLSPQQVLWAEKQREDRLRELGYEVIRVTWADLDDLVGLARRIRQAIPRARSRRPLGQPRSSST